jgi:hypothetical protein
MKSKILSALAALVAVPVVMASLPFVSPQSFASPPAGRTAPGIPPAGALSAQDVALVAYGAGFRGQALVIATAITGAESSMVPTAVGDNYPIKNCWCDSTGLWQIRSCPADDPTVTYDTSGCHPPLNRGTRAFLSVPSNNAVVAYGLATSSPSGFDNWSTYTDGSYLAYMPEAEAAVAALPGGGTQS